MKRSLEELSREAQRLAAQLNEIGKQEIGGGQHQGSLHRGLPASLRDAVINLRGDLAACGIDDPVLIRFDSATAPQATNGEIAEQLASIATSLVQASV